MVARLLIVVLTVVGAIPVRVCTCGAAHHHHPPSRPAPDTQNLPPTPATPIVTADPEPQHDPDCHAIKPRSAMALGVTPSVFEPSDFDVLVAAVMPDGVEILQQLALLCTSCRPPPRGAPLYLCLQVLRI
jgi:hypothetical protein